MASAVQFGRLATSLGRSGLLVRSPATKPVSRIPASRTIVVASSRSKNKTLPAAAAGVALSGSLSGGVAHAQDSAVVDSAVSSIVDVVRAAGDAIKAGLGVAEQGAEAAKEAYTHISPAVQTAVDAAAPVVKSAVQAATPVVEAGVRAASSAVSKPSLERALSSTGIDVDTVKGAEAAAEQAVNSARPVLESLVHFVTSSSPTTLAETALGLAAAYLLLPLALKAGAASFRGYKADVSPASALDAVSTMGNAVLLDIRTAREKEQAGVPDLGSSSGKLVELEFASVEDKRVRGQLRNVGDLEVKVTAMQAAALKRLSPGTAVYVLDRTGSTAKAVAKELAKCGFGRVFVISGGFSAWSRDRLGTKLSTSVSRVEVLLPGSMRMGSGSTRQASRTISGPGSRRALPSSTGQ